MKLLAPFALPLFVPLILWSYGMYFLFCDKFLFSPVFFFSIIHTFSCSIQLVNTIKLYVMTLFLNEWQIPWISLSINSNFFVFLWSNMCTQCSVLQRTHDKLFRDFILWTYFHVLLNFKDTWGLFWNCIFHRSLTVIAHNWSTLEQHLLRLSGGSNLFLLVSNLNTSRLLMFLWNLMNFLVLNRRRLEFCLLAICVFWTRNTTCDATSLLHSL